MRLLTERQAWLRLARAWDRPVASEYGTMQAKVCKSRCVGLCSSIGELECSGKISTDVELRMDERIQAMPERFGPYCWPLDGRGARSRAAFCRRQARLLAKRKAPR